MRRAERGPDPPTGPRPRPRLTFRQLADEFLAAKRTLRGAATAADYSARLVPLLAFADLPERPARRTALAALPAAGGERDGDPPRAARLGGRPAEPAAAGRVGTPPAKDPLRADPLPLPDRVRLVEATDRWRLCQLGLSLVLPLRLGEAAGLLVDDVDFGRGELLFGANLPAVNFTKRKVAYQPPSPDALRPARRAGVGGRGAGRSCGPAGR